MILLLLINYVVAMLMSGKGFDLSELILQNMMEVYEGQATASLPYGCLLTHIFKWYGVEFLEEDKSVVKEFLDKKCLSASRIDMKPDGSLIQLEPLPPSPLPSGIVPLSAAPNSDWELFAKETRASLHSLEQKIDTLTDELQFFRDLVLGSRSKNPLAATPQNLVLSATTGTEDAPSVSLPTATEGLETATEGLEATTKTGDVPVDENKEENDDIEST